MKQQVTLAYILGFFEADGGILLMFGTGNSKTTLKPWIRFSQKTNPNLLGEIKKFFETNGIECKYEDWNPKTSKGRARNLTITKVDSVRQFIKLVKKENFQFISQKQRDFMILDRVLNTKETLSIADKINLRKSMHKAHSGQPDRNPNGANTREQLELQYNILLGSSKEDSLGILSKIDVAYKAHVAKIKKAIADKTLVISPDWLAGLIDGDGSYYVTMQVREPSAKYDKPFIEFQGNFTLTMEKNALLTLEAVKAAINSDAPIKESKESTEHYQIWFRKQKDVMNLLQMQQAYLPVGSHRLAQYNLVRQLHLLKQQGKMRDLNEVLSVIRAAYAISANTKGRERTQTLEEMEAIACKIYG